MNARLPLINKRKLNPSGGSILQILKDINTLQTACIFFSKQEMWILSHIHISQTTDQHLWNDVFFLVHRSILTKSPLFWILKILRSMKYRSLLYGIFIRVQMFKTIRNDDIQKFIHSKKMKGYYDKIGSSASGNLISMFLLNIK